MLHRRQLPVISACDEFVGREATDHAPAHCTHCAKDVHDLSRLTEDEVIALIARRGGDLCVSYRVRDDGSIELRSRRPRFAPVTLALALTGCAGHLGEAAAENDERIEALGAGEGCPLPDAPVKDEADKYAVDPDALAAALAAGLADEPATPAVDPAPHADDPFAPHVFDPMHPGDGTSTSDPPAPSCVVTDRMRRMAEAERRFVRGKLAPLTDARICANERIRKAEERHQRRKRDR